MNKLNSERLGRLTEKYQRGFIWVLNKLHKRTITGKELAVSYGSESCQSIGNAGIAAAACELVGTSH